MAKQQFDIYTFFTIALLCVYGVIGAGLWAIQEWARYTNVLLHVVAIPYTVFSSIVLGGQTPGQTAVQIVIAAGIIYALTRPEIKYKFQTVVPKKRT